MKTPRILTASIAAFVALPIAAHAIDYNWVANPGTGVWPNGGNWDGNGVPVSGGGNQIFIHTPGSITIAGVALDAGWLDLAVGNAGAAASGYTFGAGTYNLGTLYVGENHFGTALNNGYGRAFINAGTTINANTFHLGEWDGGSGHVVQSGGAVNVAGQFRLGHWPQTGGAANSYDMNGGTFTMTGAAGNPLDEGAAGNFILGVDSSGTFTMNAGTLTANGFTMQTRGAGGGESKLVVNGGLVKIGVNGFVSSQPTILGSYDIQLGGGTIRATANWSSNLETHLVSGGTGIHYDTNGSNVTLSGVVNGAGTLAKDGSGKLIFSGANIYTGATSITAGTLQITSAGSASATDITVRNGATLQVDATGKTLQSLALQGGSTLNLAAVSATTITVANALNFTATPNFTVKPILFAAPAVNATFDLLTAGSITGTAGSIGTDFGLSHVSGHTAVSGNKLVLTIDTAGGLLTWSNAAGTGNWVTNADANFIGADGKFLNNDQVTFGNTAAGNVNLFGTLVPAGVIVNSTANYTFAGPGNITGVTSLTKSGSSTLTVGGIHTYSGGTLVNAGVLNLTAQSGGTGTIRGTVTVGAGAELRATGNTGAIFGYNAGEKIDTLNINGGLVNTVGGANHIWQATVNMTGGELRVNGGVSSATGDYYEWGNTVLNTLASATTATVSGRIRVRADASAELNLNVADGAAATDLLISAAITTQNGNININKNGGGVAELSGGAAIGGSIRATAGALTLSGGSAFTANQLLLTGDSAVTLASGASVTVNNLEVGVNGQDNTLGGTLNIGAGTALVVQNAVVFGNTLGGGALSSGIVNQTGGTVTVNAPNTDGRNFVLGHWNQGQGTYNLSAGTLNSPTISMAVSWDGDGTFALSGSGIANVLGLRFGHNPGRSGVFNLTGGTLNLGAEGIWEQNANFPNDINLGGGTIRAAVNTNIYLPVELTGTGGDVTLDTNGNTLTMTGAVTGAGGFTKVGGGRLVLNAANTASGIFTVNAGTLSLQGAQAADRIPANGIVVINSGGTVEFGSTNAAAFSANYIVNAGGTLTNAAGVDHAHIGAVQLNGGTWTTDAAAGSFDGENYFLHGGVSVGGSTTSLITQQGGSAANRGIAWQGSITFDVADATGNSTADLIVSTELEDDGATPAALVKTGLGTMRLAFANSYTGGTTVSAGTLEFAVSETLTSLDIADGAIAVVGTSGPPPAPLFAAQAVPEPGTALLLLGGLATLLGGRPRLPKKEPLMDANRHS